MVEGELLLLIVGRIVGGVVFGGKRIFLFKQKREMPLKVIIFFLLDTFYII